MGLWEVLIINPNMEFIETVNKSYQDGPEMPTTGRRNSVQRKSFHALQYLAAGSAGTHASLDTLVNTGIRSTSEPEITPARQMWQDLVALCQINPLGKAKARTDGRYSDPVELDRLWFEAFFGFIIVTNSIFIAAQIEMAAAAPGVAQPEIFFILATIYTWFFTVELVLRFLAGGPRILCEEEWAWLLVDIVVVASSLLEFILEMMLRAEVGSNAQQANVSTSMRLVRVLRVAKITRAIRIVRLVKFIRSLKTLLYCIGRTLRAMLWSGVLLILIMFLFSLVFTDVCTESVAALSETQLKTSYLYFRFGSLEDSMHTLFASITGGLTWSEVSDALAEVDGVWRLVFEAYIAFCLFAVLNVMTGVFCQSAIESAERDHELILQNVAQEKQKYFRAVRRLFSQLDRNEDGGTDVFMVCATLPQ
ncbi:putative voltage-dependent N-type calcium channel subunit alpha-1B [Symbiodinium microadriaticum]|uniref:Putative voltage-dependent N-type calcium channel subunit alpha-1B n=1 Tax=Symbiodinium microadriaticum TaxID=2951 RepID=A0A1Q9CWV9_SYMMI|nr:putative voltage-dependent N-type calcium channel subunit alpha-1B [Symbiodinium microadriaticum]